MDALPYFCLRFPQFFHRCSASLRPTIKLRLNLALRVTAAGPAYAGQRHVPSFTGAGWETTVDTPCLTHISALMTVPILHSSGVYARKILYIFWLKKEKCLSGACPHNNLFSDSYLAGLASASWCINKTKKVFITLWATERVLSFFLLVKKEQHLGSIKPLMRTLYNQKTVFLYAKSQKAEILVLFFILFYFFCWNIRLNRV